VIDWQRLSGRHDLPWQGTRDAYRIWLSEVMLQQTQVATVIPYYERFLARFPDVVALAAANDEDVMRLWSGLGYYARARNLLKAAREVASLQGGVFPTDIESVAALPGVGPSTAAAIVAFSTGEPHAILDGNVKRVMARHFGIAGAIDAKQTLDQLWAVARAELPLADIEAYTQGLMDIGATVCTRTRPACDRCPVSGTCVALREGRVGELPGRKAPRASPLREVALFVAVSRDEVLLERRPSTGIWGGLWSLPEAANTTTPADWVRQRPDLSLVSAEELKPFMHAFTHYRLSVMPWLVRVRRKTRAQDGDATVWLPLSEVRGAALPAPVKKLLASL
jgi:A/G-specific adenine glycosylase